MAIGCMVIYYKQNQIVNNVNRFIIHQTKVSKTDLVIPETVGQYTGLTDKKNGTKVFERYNKEPCFDNLWRCYKFKTVHC